jgi:hypothetical protein
LEGSHKTKTRKMHTYSWSCDSIHPRLQGSGGDLVLLTGTSNTKLFTLHVTSVAWQITKIIRPWVLWELLFTMCSSCTTNWVIHVKCKIMWQIYWNIVTNTLWNILLIRITGFMDFVQHREF